MNYSKRRRRTKNSLNQRSFLHDYDEDEPIEIYQKQITSHLFVSLFSTFFTFLSAFSYVSLDNQNKQIFYYFFSYFNGRKAVSKNQIRDKHP